MINRDIVRFTYFLIMACWGMACLVVLANSVNISSTYLHNKDTYDYISQFIHFLRIHLFVFIVVSLPITIISIIIYMFKLIFKNDLFYIILSTLGGQLLNIIISLGVGIIMIGGDKLYYIIVLS